MNYAETLQYLYEQLPMFQRVGAAAYKKDLTNTLALSEHFDNPHTKFPSIHIAGTNGKGSVAHMLAAVFTEAGYKTGLYTSPHYVDFRERIKIDGKYISEEAVIDFVAKGKEKFESIQPSFFEITVVMAFEYFAQQKVDIAIVETGLGGRLDSTNIITPELSIITNIGYDHMDMLGDTLPLIAGEKAGIIKPNIPVIIGESHEGTTPVFTNTAKERNAPILFADKEYKLHFHQMDDSYSFLAKENNFPHYTNIIPDLTGTYQQKNLSTVLAALLEIEKQGKFDLSEIAILEGISNVRQLSSFMGRWQQIGSSPTIICDSAHNEHGVREMIKQLQSINYQKLHIIWGSVKDKDLHPVLQQLPSEASYYFCQPDIPRALDSISLKEKAKEYGLEGDAFPTVGEAFSNAKQRAKEKDLILVCGSIFVVGEVLGSVVSL